jgi:hypothetical protein
MLTLEKEVVALHCKNINCKLQQTQGTRPKPKHRALILFGLFLM